MQRENKCIARAEERETETERGKEIRGERERERERKEERERNAERHSSRRTPAYPRDPQPYSEPSRNSTIDAEVCA